MTGTKETMAATESPAKLEAQRPRLSRRAIVGFVVTTILSASLLLDHLGLTEAAGRVAAAVLTDLSARDGRTRTTTEIGDAVLAALPREGAS